MLNNLQTLDTLVAQMKKKQPDTYSILADVASYYKYKLQRLDAVNESARINEYIYASAETDDSIPYNLIEWYTMTETYINKLQEEIAKILTIKKNQIKEKRSVVAALISKKHKNRASRQVRHQTEQQLELQTLQRMNQLPTDIVRYISEFALTPNLQLALYRFPKEIITTSITQMKNPIAKEFMKRMRERAVPIALKLCNIAVKSGIIKQSDYKPLFNIFGNTKKEMTKYITSAIECYEYIHNIIQHKSSCAEITPLVKNELLHIYKITKYISRPEFNKRAKPRRILQNPENQPITG